MAQTLPNGVVVPNEDGGETISVTGVAELRTLGSSVDTQLATKTTPQYVDAQVDAMEPLLFTRGNTPAGTNFDEWYTGDKSGLWYFSGANAATLTGLPPGTEGQAGQILVMAPATRVASQVYLPYGYYSETAMIRYVADIGTNSWTPWKAWGSGGGGGWAGSSALRALFVATVGPVRTGGRAAVAIRCDHGLANFKTKVLPLVQARGIKVSQAYNPRNWHYPENQGVTPTELNSWVANGDVEIWNHSASHAPADTEEALFDQIVNGLAEIEAELPAAAGHVWGWNPPGVSSGNYGGYDGGKTPAGWETYAGRLIQQVHAVGSGSLAGTQLHTLDGQPRYGLARFQMDSLTVAAIKAKIDEAVAARKGLQLMLHPSQLDLSGMLTTAGFTEVLDYLVTLRESGDLVTVSPYELALADASISGDDVDDAYTAYQSAIA